MRNVSVEPVAAESRALAARGIRSTEDLIRLASAVIADLAAGLVTPQEARAMAAHGNLALKSAEFAYRYGIKDHAKTRSLTFLGRVTPWLTHAH
jgi:hypothetical protein